MNEKDLRGNTGRDIVRSTIDNVVSESIESVVERMRKTGKDFRSCALSISMERIYEILKNGGIL